MTTATRLRWAGIAPVRGCSSFVLRAQRGAVHVHDTSTNAEYALTPDQARALGGALHQAGQEAERQRRSIHCLAPIERDTNSDPTPPDLPGGHIA